MLGSIRSTSTAFLICFKGNINVGTDDVNVFEVYPVNQQKRPGEPPVGYTFFIYFCGLKFKSLKELVDAAEADATAFYEKGNKAAGTRLRNAMQALKVAATDIRKEVTEKKNA
jgi:hypothetical protein